MDWMSCLYRSRLVNTIQDTVTKKYMYIFFLQIKMKVNFHVQLNSYLFSKL